MVIGGSPTEDDVELLSLDESVPVPPGLLPTQPLPPGGQRYLHAAGILTTGNTSAIRTFIKWIKNLCSAPIPDGRPYICAGLYDVDYRGTLYAHDFNTGAWTEVGSCPGEPRAISG